MTAPQMPQTDYYKPQPQPFDQYGYQQRQTYMINGYRMYLHGGYWYFVDYPYTTPLRASRRYHRTGGGLGILAKIMGTLLFFLGIGLMFGHEDGFIIAGAFCMAFGIFGFALMLVDSMRNHPGAWKTAATVAAAAYVVHSLTDDDR
jgi:hypothetical protein